MFNWREEHPQILGVVNPRFHETISELVDDLIRTAYNQAFIDIQNDKVEGYSYKEGEA